MFDPVRSWNKHYIIIHCSFFIADEAFPCDRRTRSDFVYSSVTGSCSMETVTQIIDLDSSALMVEKSHVGERHRHAVLVAAVDHRVIADGTAGLGNVFHTALIGAFNVVAEGEESV